MQRNKSKITECEEELMYQLRSKKRLAVMRTRKITWSVKAESLEENAKPSITARLRPSIKNVVFSVVHVGPWNLNINISQLFKENYRKRKKFQSEIQLRNYGRWLQDLGLREELLLLMIYLFAQTVCFPFSSSLI